MPDSRRAASRSARSSSSYEGRDDAQRRRSARRSSGRSSQPQRRSAANRSSAARQQARRSSNRRSAQQDPRRSYANTRNRPQYNFMPLLACILVFAIVAGAVLVLLHPWKYNVTVNGNEVTVKRNATIQDVIDAGYATPQPGNLLAVDGELCEEGKGDIFSGTVDGTETNDPKTVLKKGAIVEINDGKDAIEPYESTEETIPHGERTLDSESGSYWTGSLHVYEPGEDGLRTTKTGKVSGKTVTEETKPAVDSGYTIYTCNPGEDKVVAITFDDGPWDETTDAILDILEENGAKATFFTIGNQIANREAQVRRAKELGCMVCTHTYDHAEGSGQGVNLTYMSSEEQIQEVQKGYESIKAVLGEEPPHIMRAPGGNFYGDIITTLQPYVDAEIGWDVDTEDWREPGSDSIYQMIMSVQPGQVILCHDGGGNRSQTVEAVRQAIPELMAQGYRFVTIEELLAYGQPGASQSSDGAIQVE